MATKKPAPIMIPAAEDEMIGQIYNGIKARQARPMRLSRLGASSIGEECLRKIWMDWRGYDSTDFDGRMLRLFETGNLQEDRIVSDLKAAGYTVYEKDSNGEQFTFTDETGHFVVKTDGVIKGIPSAENTPHVLEIKTHNKKSFEELEKKGVVISKPMHYYQVQAGMLFSGIERGLYLALCKDNEQFYVRRIKPDTHTQNDILKRIDIIVNAEIRPARIGESPETYPCRWCDFKEACFDQKSPEVNCRTCEHSRPIENGKWLCDQLDIELTLQEQLDACKMYLQKGK
jgi:hypothetical protein